MKKCTVILRADDAGATLASNNAILKGIQSGVIQNVSIMAVGAHIEDAYQKLHNYPVDFGLHFTLNAEWNDFKWKPLSDKVGILTDDQGYFLSNPKKFVGLDISLEAVLAELEAQYTKLTSLGFTISYIDSHMFPELTIQGLDDALIQWCEDHKVLCHLNYYKFPEVDLKKLSLPKLYKSLKDKEQYFFLFHPAEYGDETLFFCNDSNPREKIAKERAKEAKIVGSKWTRRMMSLLGIRLIRYTEAHPVERLDLKAFMKAL